MTQTIRRAAREAPNNRSHSSLAEMQTRIDALEAELAAARERETATGEVLQVINSSPGDLAPVFDAMLERAARICQAESGFVFRLQDGLNRMVAAFGIPAEYREFQTRNPIPPGRGTLAGRTALERRVVHIEDAAADPEYTRAEAIQLGRQVPSSYRAVERAVGRRMSVPYVLRFLR